MTEELLADLRLEIYKSSRRLEEQLSDIKKLLIPLSQYFKLKMEKEFKDGN